MINQGIRRSAEFVKDLKFNDLNDMTIQKTKDCLLDLMGAILGGAKTSAGEISLQFARASGGFGEATVLPTNDKISCPGAAFVHGTMGSVLDIDDGHRAAVGHPGGVIIPAAFSIAEHSLNTGKELIEAIICGYEVGIRVGHIFRVKLAPATSLGSGRWGSVGAAAAVSKLWRLNLEEIEQALAISATFAPVAPVTNDLKINGFMPMTKFCSGWGAVVGIHSALLAKEGFTGVSSTIDFSLSSLAEYGESFEINNVYFKPYTSCRWTHPAIEGTIQLIKNHQDIKRDTIKRISVKTFLDATHLKWSHPKTMESAQYSIPFLVGAAVIDGEVGPDQIMEGRLSDPNITSIAEKVEVIHSPEMDNEFPKTAPAEIEIETKLGRCYKMKVSHPKGDPRNPMDDSEFVNKFKRLAKMSVSIEASERVIEKVKMLEKLSSLTELTNIFQRKG
jgi:2-methylcitrate dehydratase PrpD